MAPRSAHHSSLQLPGYGHPTSRAETLAAKLSIHSKGTLALASASQGPVARSNVCKEVKQLSVAGLPHLQKKG